MRLACVCLHCFFTHKLYIYTHILRLAKMNHLGRLPAELQARLLQPSFATGRQVGREAREALDTETVRYSDPSHLKFLIRNGRLDLSDPSQRKRALCHFKQIAQGLGESDMCTLVSSDELWLEGGEDEILSYVESWIAVHPPACSPLGGVRLACLSDDRRRQVLERWPFLMTNNRQRSGLQPQWALYADRSLTPQSLSVWNDTFCRYPTQTLRCQLVSDGGMVKVGRYLYAADEMFGWVHKWNADTLEECRGRVVRSQVFNTPLTPLHVRIAATGKYLILVNYFTGSFSVWDTEQGVEEVFVGDGGTYCSVAASYPYVVMASRNVGIKIWNVTTRSEERDLSVRAKVVVMWEGLVIAGDNTGSIHVYDAQLLLKQKTMRTSHSEVCALLVAGGKLFSTGDGGGGTIQVWTLGSWELSDELRIDGAKHCISLGMCGSKLLCGYGHDDSQYSLAVINLQTREVEHKVAEARSGCPTDLLCLPDGRVMCRHVDRTICLKTDGFHSKITVYV